MTDTFLFLLPWLLLVSVFVWLLYQRLLASERQTQAQYQACRENIEKLKAAIEKQDRDFVAILDAMTKRIDKLENNG